MDVRRATRGQRSLGATNRPCYSSGPQPERTHVEQRQQCPTIPWLRAARDVIKENRNIARPLSLGGAHFREQYGNVLHIRVTVVRRAICLRFSHCRVSANAPGTFPPNATILRTPPPLPHPSDAFVIRSGRSTAIRTPPQVSPTHRYLLPFSNAKVRTRPGQYARPPSAHVH